MQCTGLLFLILNLSISTMEPDIIELPEKIGNWEKAATDYYHPENLWDYINGGAELFRSYGFDKVQATRYELEDQPDIVVDIFRMDSPREAFGVYSYSRTRIEKEFGQGSQYSKGLLIFWNDRYYVSIIGHPETEASAIALKKLAEHVEKKTKGSTEIPKIISLLPEKGLKEESVKYFHHYIWLNSLHFISHDNILGIENDTDAVLARYSRDEGSPILLLVEYPEIDRSNLAKEALAEEFFGDKSLEIAQLDEKHGWTAIAQHKETLILVLKAGSEQVGKALINETLQQLKNK